MNNNRCLSASASFLSASCLAGAVVAFSGCVISADKGANPVGSMYLVSATIGSKGGSLSVTSAESSTLAGTSITVPAGALTQNETIGIAPSALSVTQGTDTEAGPVVDFGPDGLTFATPVTMTIPLVLGADTTTSDLVVQAVESSGASSELTITSINDSNTLVTFNASGFTLFGCVHHHHPDAGPVDGGPICSCPDVTSNSCTTPGSGPCFCPVEVACDGGEPTDSGVVCLCPNVPAGSCSTPGAAPCFCPMEVSCDGGPGSCQSDRDCASGQFCEANGCNAGGTCAPIPQGCPQYCAAPEICGCNGQQYCNSCMAQADGVNADPTGAACGIAIDAGQACQAESDCGSDACCITGVCISCGVSPGGGVCSCPIMDQDAGPECTTASDCGMCESCQNGTCVAPNPGTCGEADGGPVCSCPAVGPNECSVTGPAPCFCAMEVPCDGGGPIDGGPAPCFDANGMVVACDGGSSLACQMNSDCPRGEKCKMGVCQ